MINKIFILLMLIISITVTAQNKTEINDIIDTQGNEPETTNKKNKGEKETIEKLEKEIQEKTKKCKEKYGENSDVCDGSIETESNALTLSVTETVSAYHFITGIDFADLIIASDLNGNGNYCDDTVNIFDDVNDCIKYATKLKNRYYIPQGLTSFTGALNTNRYLLLSAYYYDNNELSNHAIIIKFRLSSNKIEKIYELTTTELTDLHVGGLGFHRNWYYQWNQQLNYTILTAVDIIFLTDGTKIRAYKMTSTELTALTINNQSYLDVGFSASYLSIKNGYLWVGMFYENMPDEGSELNGYLITASTTNITLGLKYELKIPKQKIQGIYSVSNPSVDKRLMFYLTTSWGNNQSYKYHAILDTKDIPESGSSKGDEIIRDGEYKWEAVYTPFNDISSNFNGLPAGAEGITKLNNITYLANEGATYRYMFIKNWTKVVEKIILIINPLYFQSPSIQTVDINNAGSIVVNGSGIDNGFGYKIILVMAQNKQGNFYYSLGELNYVSSSKLEVFVNKPITDNPIDYQASIDKKPTVYIEDVKGVYIMNLNETVGNSDDWQITTIGINFDKNIFNTLNSSDYLYSEEINVTNTQLGDDSGDKKGYLALFNTNYSSDDQFLYQLGIYNNSNYNDLYNLYTTLNGYFIYFPETEAYLESETYIQNNTNRFSIFCSNVKNNINNSNLGRLTNVTFSFCN